MGGAELVDRAFVQARRRTKSMAEAELVNNSKKGEDQSQVDLVSSDVD